MPNRKRLIIDTDPGIDDAMAIACAFNSSEVDVIGLTTTFGNVQTAKATENAHTLLHLAGHAQIPVAEGSPVPLSGVAKAVASFVHGDDGFGNINRQAVEGVKLGSTAARFIAETVRQDPGNVTVLALGPLTNLALAFKADPAVAADLGELVVLGGAYDVEGNVTPAGEANILCDPEAADFVFSQTERIRAIGLDVTLQCRVTSTMLERLKESSGRFGAFLYEAVQFYLQYHRDAYGTDAIFAHDPTAFIAVLRPDLFTWRRGCVRVICEGFARGKTLQDPGRKRWNTPNGWTGGPRVSVAVGVDAAAVVEAILRLACA